MKINIERNKNNHGGGGRHRIGDGYVRVNFQVRATKLPST